MADVKIQSIIEILLKGKGGEDAVKLLRQLESESRRTRKSLGDVGGQAKGLKGSLDVLAKSATLVRTAFAAVAGSAIIRFLKDSFTEFAKTERAAGAVAAQIRALGKAHGQTEEQINAVVQANKDFIKSLSAQTGILDDHLIPAMNRALIGFDDVAQAQEAVRIAAKLEANAHGDVVSNLEAISNAIQSKTLKSLKQFGVETKDGGENAVEFADGMAAFLEQVDQLPSKLNDAQSRVDAFARSWDTARDSIGKALDFVGQKAGGILSSLGELIAGGGKLIADPNVGGSVVPGKPLFKTPETPARSPLLDAIGKGKGDDEAAKEAERARKRIATEAERAAQDALEAQIQVEKQGSEERLELELALLERKRKVALEEVKGSRQAEAAINHSFDVQRTSEIQRNLDERAKQELEAAEKRAEAEQEAEERLLRAQLDATEEGTRARLDAQLRLLDEEYREAIKQAEKIGADTTAIRLAWEMERHQRTLDFAREAGAARAALEKELADSRTDARLSELEGQADQSGGEGPFRALKEMAEVEEQAEIERLERERQRVLEDGLFRRATAEETAKRLEIVENRITAARTRGAAAQSKLDEAQAEFRKQQYLSGAQQIIASMRTIFGESKTLAIAEAIINTYEGASRALKDYPAPFSYAVAAAVIAAGLKHVATIRSAGPGGASGTAGPTGAAVGASAASSGNQDFTRRGGFDVPAHDRMAFAGGRRWAQDQIAHFEQGATSAYLSALGRGLADGMMGGAAAPAAATSGAVASGAAAGAGPTYITNVTLKTAAVDRRTMMDLARDLERARNNDPRRKW